MFIETMLHLKMPNFVMINRTFLDNQDCMELIGLYAGMKKGVDSSLTRIEEAIWDLGRRWYSETIILQR